MFGPLLLSLAALTLWIFLGAQKPDDAASLVAAAGIVTPSVTQRDPAEVSPSGQAAVFQPVASGPASTTNNDDPSPSQAAPASADDARHRTTVVGEWHDEYRGQRHLTVRSDGTATMVVEPDSLGKLLFADKLTFKIEWQIQAGRIIMKTVGGEPEGKTRLVTKLYGDRAEYQIRELSDERMLLRDPDGKTEYDWRRPE